MFTVIYGRIFQIVLRVFAYFIHWRIPELLTGENSVQELPRLIKEHGVDRLLIVTDKDILSLGLVDGLMAGLEKERIRYVVYDATAQNPTIQNIEDAYSLYRQNQGAGVVAIGGGSPIDCAKGVCARVARPEKSIEEMKGLLKVRENTPPLYAVPTTSGSGSEATLATVVRNPATNEKYAINDPCLIPGVVVLDPLLTLNLPPRVTATTGMDALTHAVEAYIGRSNTAHTRLFAREAVKLIFGNLETACLDGQNIPARKNMQQAAFEAGKAFTRAYVGNVHAISHTLGGFYGIPHGLANAVLLPYVLEYYGAAIDKQLSELADAAEIGQPDSSRKDKAQAFIQAVRLLNASTGIPDKIEGIREEDIPQMIEHALAEANPLYPVPRIFGEKDFRAIYEMIQAEGEFSHGSDNGDR